MTIVDAKGDIRWADDEAELPTFIGQAIVSRLSMRALSAWLG